MKANRMLLCGITCLTLLGGVLTAPATAAGMVAGISSDTTGSISRTSGEQYRFTVTPPKGAGIVYSVGDGNLLHTFTEGKPTQNRNGTATYHFGFECWNWEEAPVTTGVYVKTGGKTVRLFTVRVSPDYQAIQKAEDNGHQPWRLFPDETAAEFVSDENLKAKTDTPISPAVTQNADGSAAAVFKKGGEPSLEVDLYQPVKKGAGGIWAVSRWTDLTENTVHSVE